MSFPKRIQRRRTKEEETEVLVYDVDRGNWEVNQLKYNLRHKYVNPIIILENQTYVDVPNNYSLRQRLKLMFAFLLFKRIKLPIGLIFLSHKGNWTINEKIGGR